ncbi:autotransporter-associated beta strand repeat-containing protein [Roseimicrobium sp. ORNL1]|uniref:autotransporter-associated beta strand repeat-containing protein n=1 Tax=Roseimicrobium sp. ORNL1 TaxID=2711231 RepID=UPI0013E12D54|nr:autotransporter-associated beta strand repeat-containing protein [Roseimicrobium sp. ORNL1]QIF01010.1 PEP-CTERM sorting domain-containing protein [Roseimicrobium sp. ORNL1]
MAIFSAFGQIGAQILDWHVNPSNPSVSIEWNASAIPGSPTTAAPYYGWFNTQTNAFGTYTGAGLAGGVGTIANLSRDLGGNATVTINSPVTMGMLLLGDLSGTSTYTLGGTSTLTFNTGNSSHSLLNKVLGGGDTLSVANVAIVGALDINTNVGTISSTSAFSGTGPVNFFGNGTIALRGNSDALTGTATLYGWNSTSTTARVRLGASAGNALGGNVVIGQGTRDYAGYAVLELDSARTYFDQLDNNAQLRFDGQGGRNAYFKMMGGNEEVGSIWAPEGTSVIENVESEVINTNSILTIGTNNSNSYFNGHIRSRASGAGTGLLGITKNGTGTLTLVGGEIRYGGPTIINAGRVILQDTSRFDSNVSNSGTLEIRTNSDVFMMFDYTDNGGTGSIVKSGTAALMLGQGSRTGNIRQTTNPNEILNLHDTTGIDIGMRITGTGIPAGTTVIGKTANSITLSNPITPGTANADNATFTFYRQDAYVFNSAFRVQSGTLNVNVQTAFNGGLILTGGSHIAFNPSANTTTNQSFGGGNSTVAGLSQTEGGSALFNVAGVNVTGNALFDDYAGAQDIAMVDISAATSFGGTFTSKRREVDVKAATTFANGSNIFLEGSVGGTNVTGTTIPNSSGIQTLSNIFSVRNNGALLLPAGTANINLNGSYFIIDNSGVNMGDRVANGFNFVSNGGVLRYFHANNDTNYSETLGAFTLNSSTLIIETSRSNTGFTSTLTLGSLTRANNSFSTVQFLSNDGTANTFVGGSLGTAQNKVLIANKAADEAFMGSWVTVLSRVGTTNVLEWAKYDYDANSAIATGVTPFVDADYALNTGEGTWAAGQNIKLRANGANAAATLTAARTINSLNMQSQSANSVTLTLGNTATTAYTLKIGSGGIIASGLNNAAINTVNNTTGIGRLMGGLMADGTYQLITTVQNDGGNVRDLTITAVIADFDNLTSNATSLVKAGTGRLLLGSTTSTLHQNNTYSGGTYINGGALLLRAPNAGTELDGLLGATGKAVTLNGGTLRIVDSSFNITASAALARTFRIGEFGGVIEVDNPAGGPRIFNLVGAVTGISGAATQGVLSKTGAGNLNVTSAGNNLAGGFYHSLGTTTFTGGGNIFGFLYHDGGDLTISGSGNQIGRLRFEGGNLTISGTTFATSATNENMQALASSGGSNLRFLNNNVINRELRISGADVIFGDAANQLGSQNIYTPSAVVMTTGSLEIASLNGLVKSVLGERMIESLTLGDGTLRFSTTSGTDYDFTLKSLTGNVASVIENIGTDDVNLVIESDLNLTFSGKLQEGFSGGKLGLTKKGLGMLTLSNDESAFSGPTVVEGGVLNSTNLNGLEVPGADQGNAALFVLKNGTAFRYSGSSAGFFDRNLTVGAGVEGVSFVAAGTGSTSAQTRAAVFEIDGFGDWNMAFTGAGSAHIILTGSNTGDNLFNIGIGDNGASSTSLTKTGVGTWVMEREFNTYTGTTTIMAGTLAVAADGAFGAAGGPAVRLAGGTLELRDVNYSTLETLAMEGGVLAALTGTNTWAGDIVLGMSSTINVATGASLTIGNLTGRGGLTFQGEGTLVFDGNNYPTSPALPNGYGYGGITVQAGTLVLRYHNNLENKLPNSGLNLGGGRLGATLHIANATGFTTLTEDDVSGTTLSSGAHKITRDANASNIYLKMNALSRQIGSTLELGGDNIITTDLLNVNFILGGWATVLMPDGSVSWAINSGVVQNNVLQDNRALATVPGFGVGDGLVRGMAASMYTVDQWGREDSGPFVGFLRNTDVVNGGSYTNKDTNTLRFNADSSPIVNLTGVNTVMTGGILVTPKVGGSGVARYPKIQGGTITAGANAFGSDLLVHQQSENGVFEIASVIANNPAIGHKVDNVTFTNGSRIVGIPAGEIANLYPGMQVTTGTASAPNVPAGTYIVAVDRDNNTITLSSNVSGSSTTVTLQFNRLNGTISSGTNTVLNLSANYVTTGLYVGMFVTGPGIAAGTTITAVNSSTQVTLSTGVSGGSSGFYEFNPNNGLVKNGAGILLLTGLNTYTGPTVINEGTLAILSVSNGGVASSLGASSVAAGNLIFNGGSLLFAGEVGSTDRGFTNNNEALFDVMRAASTLTMTGGVATASSISEYVLRKQGSGTLVLGGAMSGFGHTRLVAEDGTLRVLLTANDRYARADLSALEVSGGTFEVYGSTGSFSQTMPKPLTIGAGASTIRVTSEGSGTSMTLVLGDGTEDVVRYSGSTVYFEENPTLNGVPTVNGGVANIRLWLPTIYSNVILPWAVYRDTSNLSQLGVNEFATSVPNLSANGVGEIVSANSAFLHNIGTNNEVGGAANAASWNGSIANPSESDSPNQNFAGTTVGAARVQTLRFFSATADSTVTIGSTFLIERGAILMANHIGNHDKVITGGTITSGLTSNTLGVVDLIIHNYNPANDFVIDSQIVNNTSQTKILALVQSGTGTTTLTHANNTYTGATYITGGVLRVDQAGSLSANSNLVLDGGVLGLNHGTTFTRTLGTGAGQVQFTGSGGFAAYGANRTVSLNSGAALTWGLGGFVPGSDMLLLGSHDATHTLIFTNAIDLGRFFRVVQVNNGGAQVEADMTGNLSGPGGSIIKTGTGTLKLSGTNTYTGPTVVANGTLIVNSASNLGTTGVELGTTIESSTDSTAILQLAGTVANPDVMNLPITVGNKNSESINMVQTQDDFNITGTVTINRTGAMGRTFIAPNANTTATFSNITGTGGITVMERSSGAGEGTVVLAGANTYGTGAGYTGPGTAISGGTVVREGRVLLRNSGALGGTTVELGDSRTVKTDVKWATNERSITALGGFFDADSDGIGLSGGPGGFHRLSPAIFEGTVAINDRILIKDELGNPELNGIYRVASFNVDDGTVNLVRADDFDQAAEMLYGSTVTVTNPSSPQNGTTWFMAAPNVTTPNQADTDPTIWLSTAIDNNISLLADAAGIVVTNAIDINATNGAGTTTVGGSSALTSGTAEFSGAVTLQNVVNGTGETKTLTATSSTTTNDGIKFSGIIGEGAAEDTLSINKTGTGRVTLSGANTYKGTTTVSQGYLRASSNNALGGTGSQGTTVADGATLELTGNITIPSTETLTISGTGVGNGGALRNVSGDNFYNGAVQLAADARINSDAGTLTLGFTPNSVTGTNKNLTVGGAGKVVMAGAVSLGTGSVTKDGAGTLVFSASNTYSGGTTVSGGVLEVNNPVGGSGTGTGNINVTSGTLGGNGYIAPTAIAGTSITIAAGANLSVGQTGTGPVETLNIGLSGSTLVLAGTLRVDMYANEAGLTATEMDRLVFTGTGSVNLTGSSLVIGNINNLLESALTVGSQWQLIDWGGLAVVGTFSNLTSTSIPDLPTLTGGKMWDFSQLYTTGVIGITVVPEPGRAVLLLVGLGLMVMRRRRTMKA